MDVIGWMNSEKGRKKTRTQKQNLFYGLLVNFWVQINQEQAEQETDRETEKKDPNSAPGGGREGMDDVKGLVG